MTMADEEQLKILRQGAEAWNRRRDENPGLWPDLSEADLHQANLHWARLSEAYLNEANLSL